MRYKQLIILLMSIILVPFVSAAGIFDRLGDAFSSAKDFAVDRWDPKIFWIMGIAVVIALIGGWARHHARAVREQRIAREGEGELGWKVAKLGLRTGGWLTKKSFKGVVSVGRKGIGVLRNIGARREEERRIEERLNDAEQQLEKYGAYLVWQNDALQRQAMSKEANITNLAYIEKRMVNELRILLNEFSQLITYLETGNRNPQLIARATEIRNEINRILYRMIEVAELMSNQIKEQEAIEAKELEGEEGLEAAEKQERGIEGKEKWIGTEEEVLEKEAGGSETGSALRATTKAKRKTRKVIRLDLKQARVARRERKLGRRAERRTKAEIEAEKKQEEALRRIENYATAAIQNLNNPAVGTMFLKEHLKDINQALEELFKGQKIVIKNAEHIRKIHAKVYELNRKDIKLLTKKRHLSELADELFRKGERKQKAEIIKFERRMEKAAA